MTITELLERIKILLHLENTTQYDAEITEYIKMSKEKVRVGGVQEPLTSSTEGHKSMYVVVLSYEVAKNIDIDVDMKRLETMYITNMNILRSKID